MIPDHRLKILMLDYNCGQQILFGFASRLYFLSDIPHAFLKYTLCSGQTGGKVKYVLCSHVRLQNESELSCGQLEGYLKSMEKRDELSINRTLFNR